MDPQLYQRDRGELDWDQRSVAATTALGHGSNLHHKKSGFYASHGATSSNIYDQYMQQLPRVGTPSGGLGVSNYEMSKLGGSESNLPLLATQSTASLSGQTGYESQHSLHGRTPSAGPNAAYGSSPMQNDNSSGYYNQGSYHGRAPSSGFEQTVARSGSPYSRPPSAGMDRAVAHAGGTYPPQHQQQYSDRQVPSRSGSSMGHYQQSPSQPYQQSPSQPYQQSPSQPYPPPGISDPRYYTSSPGPRGNDGNLAGRGTYRQNY